VVVTGRELVEVCLLTCDVALHLGYRCSYSSSGRSETQSEIFAVAGADSFVWQLHECWFPK